MSQVQDVQESPLVLPLVLGFISWTSFAHDRYLACADRRDPKDVDKCSISCQGRN
jgi:hypothetical protein